MASERTGTATASGSAGTRGRITQFLPYLIFDGQCREAFEFYARCFGGNITAMMTHRGSPIENEVPASRLDLILHAALEVGDAMLMASDSPPEHYSKPQGLYVSITIGDVAEAERIFGELAEGGTVTMPIGKTFWAERFGMVVDRFDIPWMINCDPSA